MITLPIEKNLIHFPKALNLFVKIYTDDQNSCTYTTYTYPKKKFEINVVVQILVRISKKCSSLVLGEILSDVFEFAHFGRQVGELETSSAFSSDRGELETKP